MALWRRGEVSTRPVTKTNGHGNGKKIEITEKELEEVDEEIEIEELKKDLEHKDWQIKMLNQRIKDLEEQAQGYMRRLDAQTLFLQDAMMKMMELKSQPATPMVDARGAIEAARIARLAEKKSSELSVSEAKKVEKLPLPG